MMPIAWRSAGSACTTCCFLMWTTLVMRLDRSQIVELVRSWAPLGRVCTT